VSNLTPAEHERILDLVRDLIRARVPSGDADALFQVLDAHQVEAADYLHKGVNPLRPDRDHVWDEARGAAYFKTERTGAVHLELGTFTTFPQARIDELIAGDGLSEFLRLDFDRHYRPDLVADVTALPIANAAVDRVASNSLFEHVAYPHQIIEETFRVLRPGGVMEVVMPWVWMRHGYPHDYVRLTPQFFERVCRETGFVDIAVDEDGTSGLYNTLHNASKMAEVPDDDPAAPGLRAVHEAVIALLGALIPVDRRFKNQSNQWMHSVRVLAVKPGEYVASNRPRDTSRPLHERAADLYACPLTKAPLVHDARRNRLVCEFSGMAYNIEDGVALFTEPRQLERPREPLGEQLKVIAQKAKRRLQ
jgi:uncharacterized protein YbaR (Trm112 family)/SAM-dependent methyltransferase